MTAFQQVEDNLAALKILADEAAATDLAVKAAEDSLKISTYQYKAGTVVSTSDHRASGGATGRAAGGGYADAPFGLERALIQALGGGWDASQLPSLKDVQAKTR